MTPTTMTPLTIHEAVCARDGSGAVSGGAILTEAEAVVRGQSEQDVVVCGPDPFVNAKLAHSIESAVGPCKPDGPHLDAAGALALPHFQQKAPPPDGHTFYETPKRKAVTTP